METFDIEIHFVDGNLRKLVDCVTLATKDDNVLAYFNPKTNQLTSIMKQNVIMLQTILPEDEAKEVIKIIKQQ